MSNNSRQNNIKFYENKRILVTGHTGFKGAWMSCMLNYLRADVTGFALAPEKGCLYEQINGNAIINSIIGNIEDYENLANVINDCRPEIIIHLAAFGFMNECYDNPRRAYSTNVLGTVNLLEAIRYCDSVKSVVIVSTDKVYLNKGDGAIYSENARLGGDSPYSCSKSCMELIVKDYCKTYFRKMENTIGIAIVRASNVLAGGDHIQTRLIPSILKALDMGIPVEIRHPEQTRPWQSVLDALDGYLTVARYIYNNPLKYSGAWNIGPTRDGIKTVGWVYSKMESYFTGLERLNVDDLEVHESETLGLDITKAITHLDWKPQISIERVIELVVDFYKGQKAGADILQLCQNQIKEYYGGNNDAVAQ